MILKKEPKKKSLYREADIELKRFQKEISDRQRNLGIEGDVLWRQK